MAEKELECNKAKMYKTQLDKLLRLPKLKQKTPEWYAARNNLITASDFAQALGEGKFGTQRQLIEKKVCIEEQSKQVKNIFFEWGNMFEPVACDIYSLMKQTFVHEFGLLIHPMYPFFGASPDGITQEGIMLEIKCPFKRKIGGDIPLQYYYQIQGQLDVCGLDLCDYFECEFQKYDTYDAYRKAYGDSNKYTGIIRVTKCKGTNERHYEYDTAQTRLVQSVGDDNVIYWILEKFNLQRVTKDSAFIKEKIVELQKVWEKILYYRDHRERFEIEIRQSLSVDTQTLHQPKISMSGHECMIVELE